MKAVVLHIQALPYALFVLTLLCVLYPASLRAEYRNSQIQKVHSMVQESYDHMGRRIWDLKIAEIERSFLEVNAHDMTDEEFAEWVSLKHDLCLWRLATKTYLLGALGQNQNGHWNPAVSMTVIEHLSQLQVRLLPDDVDILMRSFGADPRGRLALHDNIRLALSTLLLHRGEVRAARQAMGAFGLQGNQRFLGPDFPPQYLNFRPYKKSKEKKADGLAWLDEPLVDQYEFVGENAVRVGELIIPTGTLIKADQALPGEGALLAFQVRPAYFIHTGTVVIIHHNGRRIPAVLEIHEGGSRLVPLSLFLSPEFTYYAELFQIPEKYLPADWAVRVSNEAKRIITRKYRYDFLGRSLGDGLVPDTRTEVTCETLSELLLRSSGVDPAFFQAQRSTRFRDGALQNMRRVSIDTQELRSPSDIFGADVIRFGVIDNSAGIINTARHFVVSRLGDIFTERKLKFSSLIGYDGLQGVVVELANGPMSGWTWLYGRPLMTRFARALARIDRLKPKEIPFGPAAGIALYLKTHTAGGVATRRLTTDETCFLSLETLAEKAGPMRTVMEFQRSPEVTGMVDKALYRVFGWFK